MTDIDQQKQSKKRSGGLGKGLNSLLGLDETVKNVQTSSSSGANMLEIDVNLIQANPRQPRKIFNSEELESLAQSLKVDGVVQPLIVTKEDNRYILIAGERRWRASKIAGLDKVPVLVKKVSPDEMLRLAIIENVQRSDLNVIEEAEAYAALIKDFGLTQEECAQKVGKDRATIANLLRILALPLEIQEDLMIGTMTMGHGRALLGLSERKVILRARDIIVAKRLNVRQTEQLVKKIKKIDDTTEDKQEPVNADLAYLADSLRSLLRTKVRLAGNGSRGKIEISYFSASELERLLQTIGGKHFE